jgi:hypothetical protein
VFEVSSNIARQNIFRLAERIKTSLYSAIFQRRHTMRIKFFLLISIVFTLTVILTNTAGAELIGWWKLDEGFRSTFADSSGFGHDGIMDPPNDSKVRWTLDSYKGSALEFLTSAAPFTICDAPLTPGLLNIAESTYSFWEKTPLEYQEWGPALVLIGVEHDSDFELTDAGVPFIFGEPDSGGVGYEDWAMASGATLNDDLWHHITVTYSASNQLAVYYLDGIEVINNPEWNYSDPILTVRIGGPRSSDTRRMWRNYIGTLDEVAVFNHALTADEVALLYRFGPKPTPKASNPSPLNGAVDVTRDVVLSWDMGIYGSQRNVYIGTNFNDVDEATLSDPRDVLVSESQNSTSFDPIGNEPLEYGRTYYWRIDEINDLDPNSPWKGDIWSFTTLNYLPVDNFEGYNDVNNIIYNTWSDYFVNNTGMTTGHIEPPTIEQNITHLGRQSMPLHYDNDGTVNEGTDLETTGTLFYSETERRWADAQDWTREGVESLSLWFRGYPAQVSSFVEEPAGTFSVTGIGGDIWDRSDEFHFAYKQLSGSVKIIARVDSLENTDPFAKAGIMLRDTLDANARYCALLMTPENGVRYQYRSSVNDITDRQFDPNVAVPYWLRLERTGGGLVRAYYSANGSDWLSFPLRSLTMANPIYVGLAVTSHDTVVPCQAKFSNVSFPDTTVGPEWTAQDIGILTNEVEPMYVALNGDAVIFHDDPNAVLTDQWTEWKIPLQNFTDKGVNLTNVNSLGIGIGNRDSSQPGGKGIVYIDDIRLYRPTLSEGN